MPELPRVLQLGPDPSLGGGMAASLRGLLESPLRRRYRLDVVPTYRGPAPLRRLAVFLAALARLTAWALRRRGRVVHVHATVRGSLYRKSICVLLAKALRRRVILHVHSGPGDLAAFRAASGRSSLALFAAAFAAADAILAVSNASARALERAFELSGVEVVPNAPPLAPAFRRDPLGRRDAVELAYLGGFANPAKGGDVILEALALALPQAPRLRVTLAGPGELPGAGAALAAKHPRVTWAGWLDPAGKDELLRSARLFAMPSRSEGLPMALLEAMAYGLAIVATEVGGIPEALESGEEGLLVAPERPPELANALVALTADPGLCERLGQGARRRAERLDTVEVADRLDALYASLG